MPKQCIFGDSLLIVSYVEGALQKELPIAPFVEPLLLWESLTNKFYHYLEQFTYILQLLLLLLLLLLLFLFLLLLIYFSLVYGM